MERQLVWLLEFIRLSNNHSSTKYRNFCFTELCKLNKFMHGHKFCNAR